MHPYQWSKVSLPGKVVLHWYYHRSFCNAHFLLYKIFQWLLNTYCALLWTCHLLPLNSIVIHIYSLHRHHNSHWSPCSLSSASFLFQRFILFFSEFSHEFSHVWSGLYILMVFECCFCFIVYFCLLGCFNLIVLISEVLTTLSFHRPWSCLRDCMTECSVFIQSSSVEVFQSCMVWVLIPHASALLTVAL